jgi:putative flavoprotein involved in K+ transport
LRWPEEQRFLTPSFTGNGFGATDLNSVHPDTSPAFSLGIDYPAGDDYARYLRGVAKHFATPILKNTEVTAITRSDGVFTVDTTNGPVQTRTVVWAGGEFQSPAVPRIAGSGVADHASDPAAWQRREGALVVIGGYESGIDLACHHVAHGTAVTVVDEAHPWDAQSGSDPSFRLSPRTRQRLAEVKATGLLTLSSAGRAAGIRPNAGGSYSVAVAGSNLVHSDTPPILATGYGHGLGPAAGLFELRADGWPLLDDDDQSTITPGLYLAGAAMRHGALKFCFIYKFRQRFAHVAGVIGKDLGKNVAALEAWRSAGMLTDDLSCCGVECAC